MKARPTLRLLALLLLCLAAATGATAQQNKELRRSKTIFLFPEFTDAKVRQTFGRSVTAKANIFLKDASLCYMDNGKIKRAYTRGIVGVDFGDTLRYMKVDSVMGRVVAQRGYNYLLCVTSVDRNLYNEETTGGSHMNFFEMSELNLFMQLDGQEREEDFGLPLQDKYYFSVGGQTFPASETYVKKLLSADKKKAFRKMTEDDRWWSWSDPKSLEKLFDLFPTE